MNNKIRHTYTILTKDDKDIFNENYCSAINFSMILEIMELHYIERI